MCHLRVTDLTDLISQLKHLLVVVVTKGVLKVSVEIVGGAERCPENELPIYY